ncbi:MAG: hypothetical protein DME04_25805 [Candidatus Rokuibacteriota bacterium]|nr:MAG: hypothetical protein DME04_25805 [Candidatus Rokubacteria bacterium]
MERPRREDASAGARGEDLGAGALEERGPERRSQMRPWLVGRRVGPGQWPRQQRRRRAGQRFAGLRYCWSHGDSGNAVEQRVIGGHDLRQHGAGTGPGWMALDRGLGDLRSGRRHRYLHGREGTERNRQHRRVTKYATAACETARPGARASECNIIGDRGSASPRRRGAGAPPSEGSDLVKTTCAQGDPMNTLAALDRNTAGAIASITFTACDLLVAARARARAQARPAARGSARAKPAERRRESAVAGRRREVVVGGRRAKVIDVHAHCVIPEAQALLGLKTDVVRGPGIDQVGPRRIGEMDAQGIDMEAISINPAWYRAERDVATQVVKIQNERLAEYCATYPDRFVGFASVALQFPDLAVQQLVDGVKRLGLRGAAVGASVAGDEFSDPKFHPFWAKAEELGVLIFIHPQSTPDLARRFKGNGWLANTIGNPLDTTIALSHLIFEGTLDRFPGLKICSAHGGGYLPSYAPRSDNSLRVAPDMDTGVKLKKKPTEYLRQMYYDTLVFTSEALRHLAAEVGSSQLVVGTDHPIPWQDKAVDHILKAPGFTDAERRAMLGETAARLLRIKL